MAFADDAVGDAFTTLGAGATVLDITRLRAFRGLPDYQAPEETLQVSVRFASLVQLNGTGGDSDVAGYIELDVDGNAATGESSTYFNAHCPGPVAMGKDLQINLTTDATDGFVDVEDHRGNVLGAAAVAVTGQSHTLTVDVPVSLIGVGNAPRVIAALGTVLEVTDCAVDGVLLESVARAEFDGEDEYEQDDSAIGANFAGGATGGQPYINMFEDQLRTFDSAGDEEWIFIASSGSGVTFGLNLLPEIEDDPGFHPVVDFFDSTILLDPAAPPTHSVGGCDHTGLLDFTWSSAFMRIRNCADSQFDFTGTYRLRFAGVSQIDPPGGLLTGQVTEAATGLPVPFIYVVTSINGATFSSPTTGEYLFFTEGPMTVGIVDDVFVAPPQTVTVPAEGTLVVDFSLQPISLFSDGFE